MLKTPICLDESITSLDRAQDMVTLGAGRLINIKPGRVGGFAESLAIHDFCEVNGMPVWCGGMLESGIGRAYNVALASLSNFPEARRPESERALLGAGRRDTRVDDEQRRHGHGAVRRTGHRRDRERRPHRRPDGAGRTTLSR